MVTMRMRADLRIQIGTRLLYDCPMMSGESFSSDAFFKKYGGREATVVELTTKIVPPFNREGLVPGIYYDGGLKIQFDGEDEVHDRLNLNHFVVIGPAELVQGEPLFNFVSRLSEQPAFYPLDVVAKADDLLATPRLVTYVDFDKQGRLVCHLANTEDMERHRKVKETTEREQAQAKKLWPPVLSFRSDEQVFASELRLVERGNGFRVYHDQGSLDFASPEEELSFWALDGLSKVVYENRNWMFSLSGARELVHVGKADIVVASRINRHRGADYYEVRRLHDQFRSFRKHIRTLGEKVGAVSVEQSGDSFKALTDVLTLR